LIREVVPLRGTTRDSLLGNPPPLPTLIAAFSEGRRKRVNMYKVVKSWLVKEVLLAHDSASRVIEVPVHKHPNAYLMELSPEGLQLFYNMVSWGMYPDTTITVNFVRPRFKDLELIVSIADNKISCKLSYDEGAGPKELPVPRFNRWHELEPKIEDLWGFTTRGFVCNEQRQPLGVLLDPDLLKRLEVGISWVPSLKHFVLKR